jgi:hypothetical protein
MLDLAEKGFIKIARSLIKAGTTVRRVYGGDIVKEHIEGQFVELLAPGDFFDGLDRIQVNDLKDIEKRCLLAVLAK